MQMKKSEPWSMTLELEGSTNTSALQASIECEEAASSIVNNRLIVQLVGKSASDLRARYNSIMRSLFAAFEVLDNLES
ncbi:MAG: hypothetical protein QF440_00800 [Candidatus Thalassarchaeaceae archaeon]|nr:hypothetical protein [Candidatus Thalassarchaeaceae archaeon]